ncbi:hypothetical protein K2Y11_12630 [bacterium]|nr:hypothetical protein [bacterium]
MTHQHFVWAAFVAVVMAGAQAKSAQAQVLVAPTSFYFAPAAPVVVAPPVAFYTAPVAVAAPVVTQAPVVAAAPTVSMYAAPVVSNVAPPIISTVPATVGFYTPVTTPYPVTVSRGLFGRTIVRTPWSVTKY